ncbi:hypothetical protein [Longimicrobium terrae]|uniref:Uncharacterized protein n=1 Tax=Longimicrobium terrae TaxID=1639882 RepID=A0A841H754_9BACT|nr:hypothetical protein [Longimicrobium terrae]MBB4638257.1 hypothetical protein [Longimicrobium terrae]MBB6073773.1 hypothetical protein [Longimicrobium terrae]NNC30266.1 hypothetical protein [Longimicrobium terrae]
MPGRIGGRARSLSVDPVRHWVDDPDPDPDLHPRIISADLCRPAHYPGSSSTGIFIDQTSIDSDRHRPQSPATRSPSTRIVIDPDYPDR